MISGREIQEALKGNWLLFCDRAEGARHFDLSIEGFWRSFQVAFLLLPFLVLNGMAQRKLIVEESGLSLEQLQAGPYWQSQLVAYVGDWIGLPLVLLALAGMIGIKKTYVPYITVRNWAGLLAALPYSLVAVLYLMGAIAGGVMVLLSLSVFVVVLWFHYRVARHVLQASISLAIGVVVLDALLSMVIGEMVSNLFGIVPPTPEPSS